MGRIYKHAKGILTTYNINIFENFSRFLLKHSDKQKNKISENTFWYH